MPYAIFLKQDHKSVLVDLFKKSEPKFPMHLRRETNYLVRKIFV